MKTPLAFLVLLTALSACGQYWKHAAQSYVLRTTAPPVAGFPSGRIHRWTLDETSGNRADSVGSLTFAEVSLTTSKATNGLNSNALVMTNSTATGVNALETTASETLSPPFSIVVWFKTFAVLGTDVISFQTAEGLNGARFLINASQVDFRASGDAGAMTASASTNTWHMAVGTYDGTTGKLSIDGGAFSSSAQGTGQDNDVMFIDYETQSVLSNVGGLFDEISIFNKALSAGEVTSLWAGGSGLFQ